MLISSGEKEKEKKKEKKRKEKKKASIADTLAMEFCEKKGCLCPKCISFFVYKNEKIPPNSF
jgi:hypothetical protein